MLTSWRTWRLPHVRWIWSGVYIGAAVVAIVLEAGVAAALIGAVAGVAVVGPLEWRYRHRHPVRAPNSA